MTWDGKYPHCGAFELYGDTRYALGGAAEQASYAPNGEPRKANLTCQSCGRTIRLKVTVTVEVQD